MSALLYWAADNVALWRPLAVMVLAALALGAALAATLAWEGEW